MFADVVIENKSKYTDVFYTYGTGEFNILPGSKVKVPFGKKTVEGYVFGIKDSVSLESDVEIKDILEVDPSMSLTEEIVKTAAWMKSRYAIRYYDALHCFIPKGKLAKEGKEKEPYKDICSDYAAPQQYTEEQSNAIKTINAAILNDENRIFLVHGVTASGKTEVYMAAIEQALRQGKTAIMLVPEISLTGQIIERFAGRFGKENIACLHSKLTQRERFDEWQRIRHGKAKVVIGARLGVFAPLDNIGLIIMDEEHEATYKADMSPKYETVDIAAKRLKHYNGVLILGSATPSVVSYHRAKEGIYSLIELKERYNKTPLPSVEIVDMRDELKKGNTSVFSNSLYNNIGLSLENGKQVILLQNRRGYANFVSCRECGWVMKCPECGISLTYHKLQNSMICHYCGKKQIVPQKCPDCGSKKVKYMGIGTEQVAEEAARLFPDASVDRLDLDAVSSRTDYDRILGRFKRKSTDILIGTQMVAKGLDFDNVGLVGVIMADTVLNIPDYRSSERTYQLITQVSGRAGRGDEQGRVVIQSYQPENFTFLAAQNNDYESFFNEEIKLRKMMNYPPYGDIIMVNFTSESEEISLNTAEKFRQYFINAAKTEGIDVRKAVLSPKSAYNFKGQNSFRNYILIKCSRGNRNRFVYLIERFQQIVFEEKTDCAVNCDVNPYSII